MDVNWVNARWSCAPQNALPSLAEAVEADVNSVNELQRRGVKFNVIKTDLPQAFVVTRQRNLAGFLENVSVVFRLSDNLITVRRVISGFEPPFLSAVAGLDEEDGECRFTVDGQNLKPWQLRWKLLNFACGHETSEKKRA